MAHFIVVHYVVVYEGEIVNKLDGSSCGHSHFWVTAKTNYHTRNTHIKEHGLTNILSNFTDLRPSQGDRIVFKCIYKINTEEEIKSNLKWECEYRLKELKNRTTTLCTYPVENILSELSDSIGAHAKWMSDLLNMYDGVIFAHRFWKGVAFNLD